MALVGLVAAPLLGIWAALWVGGWLIGQPVPANPPTALLQLITGKLVWPGLAADIIAVLELVAVAGLGWSVWRWRTPTLRQRTPIDRMARHLGRAEDLGPYAARAAAEKAARLHPGTLSAGSAPSQTGIVLGDTLTHPVTAVTASWEDTIVVIAGPRVGKTSSYVIPPVIDAPGPVLVTTVRRDVWDATSGPRSERGRLWNFDLQGRIDTGPALWWVDLLETVRDLGDANRLAQIFADGTREHRAASGGRNDYFDTEGQNLVATFLLAAALKPGGTMHDVHTWLTNPKYSEASTVLRGAGHLKAADHLDETRTLTSQGQQDGVYGFARSMMSALLIPAAMRWIAPDVDAHGAVVDERPRFSPRAFVTSTDTLYLHSKKGTLVTPLVAALTQAVLDAGDRLAHQLSGGRLDPPLLNVLDEAANICPLRTLPDDQSTFGGSGMPTITILQSFEQGVDAWGREGMNKLWGAATVRIYGGGSGDPQFLDMLSKLLGPRDRTVSSTSTNGHGWTSTSYQTRRDNLADISDLSALPVGRSLLFAAALRPTLLQTRPWWHTPHAPRVQASIEASHSPTGASEVS